MTPCLAAAHWWDTDSTTVCELPLNHEGDHCDGERWFAVTTAGGMTSFAVQRPTDNGLTRTRTLIRRFAAEAIFHAWHGGTSYAALAREYCTTEHNIRCIVGEQRQKVGGHG